MAGYSRFDPDFPISSTISPDFLSDFKAGCSPVEFPLL
jgi:hypothetical protein